MIELNKSLSASMSLVKYFYLVIHVYGFKILQIAWIYILYMFVICASTCLDTTGLRSGCVCIVCNCYICTCHLSCMLYVMPSGALIWK